MLPKIPKTHSFANLSIIAVVITAAFVIIWTALTPTETTVPQTQATDNRNVSEYDYPAPPPIGIQ